MQVCEHLVRPTLELRVFLLVVGGVEDHTVVREQLGALPRHPPAGAVGETGLVRGVADAYIYLEIYIFTDTNKQIYSLKINKVIPHSYICN